MIQPNIGDEIYDVRCDSKLGRLLLMKGYDYPCNHVRCEEIRVPLPTLQCVTRWLRERHNIFIQPVLVSSKQNLEDTSHNEEVIHWSANIYKLRKQNFYKVPYNCEYLTSTPILEDTYEGAMLKAVTDVVSILPNIE